MVLENKIRQVENITVLGENSVQSWDRRMLLDHPIRPRQHSWRDRHADLLSGLQIGDKLELRRLFDWNVGRFRSLQDFVHEVSGAPE
jgi:hypothetical protein